MATEAEKILRDFGSKIEELIDRAKDSSGDMREDLDEAIEALKKQRDKFEEKMKDVKTKNEPKVQEAKVHLRTAMEEMNKAFQKMFRKGPDAEVVDDTDGS
ncbi:MAG: hypothetical protein HEP71_27370 [Roseivirga sp.]|nr:hypothetical protein [Roseivirga sp.]